MLAHLARTARDWQKLTAADSADYRFFDAVKEVSVRDNHPCQVW